MSFFPCKNWSDCSNPAEGIAVRNFSAEQVDRFTSFGQFQCRLEGTNPEFSTCTSIISQEQSDFCAARCFPDSIFTNDLQSCSAPCGSTFTVPAGSFLGVDTQSANALAKAFACASVAGLCSFSNAAQSCTVQCPDSTSSTYTVPAGVFFGPSQAILNAQAQALACEMAGLQCFGTLFSNTEQSCSTICPATGGTATVVIPAGTVLGLSQESANARALEIACTLALLACDSLPPLIGNLPQSCSQICLGVTTTQTVPAGAFVAATQAEADQIAMIWCALTLAAACAEQQEPDVINVGSEPQTCSIPCEGGGTFSSTVQAGAFRLENRAAANAAALSYCQAHIVTNRFCLGALDSGVCVNQVYAAAVSTTGPGTPTVMGVTSGVIPTGLSLSGGLLSGIPNTPGSYTFTISAASVYGFAQRTYTIAVGEITPDFLPAGTVGTPYAVALTATGFTSPEFSIVGGALPDGLVLLPFTGGISGTPTTEEDSAFVVQATDGNLTCLKEYEISVTNSFETQMYWTLDNANPLANTDSISGTPITFNNFGSVISAVPAIVSNGVSIDGPFCTFQQQSGSLAYNSGVGFSLAFWMKWSSLGTGNEGLVYTYQSVLPNYLTWTVGTGEFHFSHGGVDTMGNTPIITADVFHLVVFVYDSASGNLYFSVDNGALILLGAPGVVVPTGVDPLCYLLYGNEIVVVDEVCITPFPMNAGQISYLWNGSSGRSFPLSFPP